MWRHSLVALVVGMSGAVTAGAPTTQQAAAFEAKMNAVIARGEEKPTGYRTEFTGDEVNAYLQLRLTSKFPSGVSQPAVALHDQGRLSGSAVVDLDGIRKRGSGGWLDPTSYLTGTLPITASGTLQTAAGRGQFSLETAEVSGIPIPKTLLQEIVSYYTRSPEMPGGVSLDEPFDLPAQIQRIDVSADRAAVVQ
jgi:hypothetical protein